MVLNCGQGSGIGGVADTCLTAAGSPDDITGAERQTPVPGNSGFSTPTTTQMPSVPWNAIDTISATEKTRKIPRSESYRHIIEAAEGEEEEGRNVFFFNRFKPTAKFVNIERVPRSKSVKM